MVRISGWICTHVTKVDLDDVCDGKARGLLRFRMAFIRSGYEGPELAGLASDGTDSSSLFPSAFVIEDDVGHMTCGWPMHRLVQADSFRTVRGKRGLHSSVQIGHCGSCRVVWEKENGFSLAGVDIAAGSVRVRVRVRKV